jgi:hypothetical protein
VRKGAGVGFACRLHITGCIFVEWEEGEGFVLDGGFNIAVCVVLE